MNKRCLQLLHLFVVALSTGLLTYSSGQDPKKSPAGKEPPLFGGGFPPFAKSEQKLVDQFDKNGDGRLNNEERKQARQVAKKQSGRPGFPGGFGGRPGFGLGRFLAKPFLEAVDSDRDGKVTGAELRAGVQAFYQQCDRNKQGHTDEKAIAEELVRVLPAPKGPPEGGPKPPPGGGFPGFPGGGFARFGGSALAGTLVKRADADKDGRVTLKEMLADADTIFKQTDKNADGKLDDAELSAGISQVMPGPGGFGPPGGFGGREARDPARPGPRVQPADVATFPNAPLYAPNVLRTLFLQFENDDWEAELADFHNTDVEVPATLTVDGKTYPNVGIHFRGMSSYMMVPAGYKRSLNLSLDFADPQQRLYGYKTLNLLNSNADESMLSTVLYSHIARQYIPAPQANFVKVVINGESWGVYVNVQQFNKDFLRENYKNPKGARWKVSGSPGGGGGLDYLGASIEDYRRKYEIKSDDDPKDWQALVTLCRTLNKTPLADLENALKPMLDIDGTLKFLALDVALANSDGYWVRGSDYSLFRDKAGVFHVIPHDMNEAFRPAMGFGFGGFGKGPKGFGDAGDAPKAGGAGPDPLVALDDARKPLRSRLLAVPGLKARYLEYVRAIATDGLDWSKLGPVVARNRALIEQEVEQDTRKLSTLAAFRRSTADVPAGVEGGGPRGGMPLRTFADQRRAYLLNYREAKGEKERP